MQKAMTFCNDRRGKIRIWLSYWPATIQPSGSSLPPAATYHQITRRITGIDDQTGKLWKKVVWVMPQTQICFKISRNLLGALARNFIVEPNIWQGFIFQKRNMYYLKFNKDATAVRLP